MLTPLRVLLLSTLVFAAPAMAQTAPQEIDVALSNFAFAPNALTFKAGTTYRLHLTNEGNSDHNFTARDFFAASTVAQGDADKVQDGEVEVPKGSSVDVTVTPNRAGAYDLECTHFLHATFGMTGRITVQ
ncbi:MAG: cupredoxin domain-containing protein [Rhizomicrobium sp.]